MFKPWDKFENDRRRPSGHGPRCRAPLQEGKVIFNDESGTENLNEIFVSTPAKASSSTEFMTKIVNAVGTTCQTVTAEYSSNKPLKLTFALANAIMIEYFMAPRVED